MLRPREPAACHHLATARCAAPAPAADEETAQTRIEGASESGRQQQHCRYISSTRADEGGACVCACAVPGRTGARARLPCRLLLVVRATMPPLLCAPVVHAGRYPPPPIRTKGTVEGGGGGRACVRAVPCGLLLLHGRLGVLRHVPRRRGPPVRTQPAHPHRAITLRLSRRARAPPVQLGPKLIT
jgi:hypothetical protein